MATFWSGLSFTADNSAGAPEFEVADVLVEPPCTLLRTLIWVAVSGYGPYEEGDSGLRNLPVGYAFADLNSFHHDVSDISQVPGNGGEELIATDMLDVRWTGLGWAPNSTGSLTGSVNDIDSSATLATDENINAFMYGAGRSFVDSHGERLFETTPVYKWRAHDWATSIGGGISWSAQYWVMVRLLYRTF